MNIIKDLENLLKTRQASESTASTLSNTSLILNGSQNNAKSSLEDKVKLLALENERVRKLLTDLRAQIKREERVLNQNNIIMITNIIRNEDKLKTSVEKQEHELKSKISEVNLLKEKLSILEKEKEGSTTGVKGYVLKIQQLEIKITELKAKLKEKHNESVSVVDNTNISQMYKDKMMKLSETLNKVQNDNALIKFENTNLRNQVEKLKAELIKGTEVKEEDKLKNELSFIKSTLVNLKDEQEERRKSQIVQPQTEESILQNSQRKTNFDYLYEENQGLQKRLLSLEEQIKSYQKETSSLREELNSTAYKSKIETLETSNKSLEKSLEQKNKECSDIEKELKHEKALRAELELKLHIAQTQVTENQSQLAREMERDNALYKQMIYSSKKEEGYQGDNDEGQFFKTQRRINLETDETNYRYKKRITELETENAGLTKSNGEMKLNLQIIENKHIMELERKENKISTLTEKLEDLKANMQTKENTILKLETKLEKQLRETKDKIKELKSNFEKESQINFDKLKNEQERLYHKEKMLKDFKTSLLVNDRQPFYSSRPINPTSTSLYEPGNHYIEEEERERSVQHIATSDTGNVAKLKALVNELMEKLNSANNLIDNKSQKITNLKKEKDKLVKENDQLTVEKNENINNLELLQKRLRTSENMVDKLRSQITDSEKHVEQLQKEISEKNEELRQKMNLIIKAEELEEKNEYYEDILEQQKEEIFMLQQKLEEADHYIQQLGENQSENSSASNQLGQIKHLKKEIKTLIKALKKSEDVIRWFKEEYSTLKELYEEELEYRENIADEFFEKSQFFEDKVSKFEEFKHHIESLKQHLQVNIDGDDDDDN